MKTLIGIVLDESSSMYCRLDQVLSDFNKFVEDQKKITDDSAKLFLVKFSSRVRVIHSGTPLDEVTPLTDRDYMPDAICRPPYRSTALYDAIAQCVQIMDEEKTSEERAICVIMTDGEENCSQKTTIEDIQRIISTHEQQNDWTFLYFGVEIAEWVRTSGMRPSHCSSAYSRRPLPSYRSHLGSPWSLQNRRNRQLLFNNNRFERRMGQTRGGTGWSREPEELEEMAQLTSAVSGIRRSTNSSSSNPFNRSD